MSNDKRTTIGLPKNGVYVPSGLEDHKVEVGPAEFVTGAERPVYLDDVKIGVVYPSETSGGRPTSKGSNIVMRNTTQKVWRVRGDVPIGIGAARYWETRKAAVWALVVQYVAHKASGVTDVQE